MKRALKRVLAVRALLEERAQLNLEQRNGEMRRLEMAADRERSEARSVRGAALRQLTAGVADWLLEIADAEMLAWKSARLREGAEARRPEVEAARTALLDRRVERRQVETLVSEAAAAEARDEARREQGRIDDWYQSRAAREKPDR